MHSVQGSKSAVEVAEEAVTEAEAKCREVTQRAAQHLSSTEQRAVCDAQAQLQSVERTVEGLMAERAALQKDTAALKEELVGLCKQEGVEALRKRVEAATGAVQGCKDALATAKV